MTPELLEQLNKVRWEMVVVMDELGRAADSSRPAPESWELLGDTLVRLVGMTELVRAIRVML